MEEISHRNFSDVPIVWKPGPNSGQLLKNFMNVIKNKYAYEFGDYWDLHKWSIDHFSEFWEEVWRFVGVIHSTPYIKVLDLSAPMSESSDWFSGAKMNFAENVLKYRDDHIALICAGEDKETEKVTYSQMYEETKLYAAALKRCGLKKGDRVACYMSNRKEPIFACLGVTSMGGIWTGSLPLLGAKAVLSRLKQVEPKILFTIDRFRHDQEEKEMLHKVREIVAGLPSLEKVVIVPSKEESKLKDISDIKNSCWLQEFLELGREADGSIPPLEFERGSFNRPVFISYTSGTTGLPKAVVHGSGGILSVSRDFLLHSDSSRDCVFLSMSPVGWTSWTMFTTMHFLGITVVIFEGVPYFLSPTYLWDMVDECKISHLVLTVNTLDDLEKKGYTPTEKHKLTSLKSVMSGGSVVKPQNYDFVYKRIKTDVIFSSVYGSTEVIGSSLIHDHTLKIHRGELTCVSLGIGLEVIDDSGKLLVGEIGEMVISTPSPTLPIGLWGDEDGSRYKKTYFSKFPGIYETYF